MNCDTSLWGALPELQEESENSELELLHQEEEEEEEEPAAPATPTTPETSKQASKFVESFIPKDTEGIELFFVQNRPRGQSGSSS